MCIQISIAQSYNPKADTVGVVKDFKNLYSFRNFYLGGQPNFEELQWLKKDGINMVVNLRSDKENKEFSDLAFNEENVIKNLGIEYCSIPVDGLKDYTPEKLNEFIQNVAKGKKVFIHCASAGRASDFFIAYLVKSKGYTVNEATEVGKKLKFVLPLEKLLHEDISMDIKK